jgi:anaerobic ribonucleoside-triphosphate reductase
MKKSELQSLINECIGEVLNEGKAAKKKLAIKEIKRIIAENELSEYDLEEISVMGTLKRAGDIGKQALGISSEKDKAAAIASLDMAIKDLGKEISKEQKDKLIANAKSYSFMGEFKVTKDSKGNKIITFDGKSAAPKTINPNPSGAK